MKGMNKEEGITFGDLIKFIDNNKNNIPKDTIIRIEPTYDDQNNYLRDILIDNNYESIRLYNYI